MIEHSSFTACGRLRQRPAIRKASSGREYASLSIAIREGGRERTLDIIADDKAARLFREHPEIGGGCGILAEGRLGSSGNPRDGFPRILLLASHIEIDWDTAGGRTGA